MDRWNDKACYLSPVIGERVDHYTSNKDREQIKDECVGKNRENTHGHQIERKANNVNDGLEHIHH